MAKDHYIPAAYIGRFSGKSKGRARERPIAVYNVRSKTIRTVKASSIGARKGMYKLVEGDRDESQLNDDIDNWAAYETSIPRVLDQICNREGISLDDWVHVAVPFVTGLFVRGREFDTRYESRPGMAESMQKGDVLRAAIINGGRALEMCRLLAPVMAARWTIIRGPSHCRLISNDRGLAATQDRNTGQLGWVVPLDKNTALGIFPQTERVLARWTGTDWTAHLVHGELSPSDTFDDLNRKLATCCNEFIYGCSEALMKPLRKHAVKQVDPEWLMEFNWAQISRQQRVAHERDWYTVSKIAATNMPPDNVRDYDFSDRMGANDRWSPPIYWIPSNLSSFPPGISVSRSSLKLTLDLLDDFDDHILRCPPPHEDTAADANVSDNGV